MSQLTEDEALNRLNGHFLWANEHKFEGILPADYHIAWNPLLRRLTGRITYHERLIEISTYHFQQYGFEDAVQTLEHEMLHLYLHRLHLPSGHNANFRREAGERGIRVFHSNHYPRNREPRDRYIYRCPSCARFVFRRRRQDNHRLACGICCRTEANGFWDPRFKLELLEKVRMV